jgi:hypothetical protein
MPQGQKIGLLYVLGRVLTFSEKDIPSHALTKGWAKAEGGSRWTDGICAEMKLHVLTSQLTHMQLSLSALPFLVRDKLPTQFVQLFGNGRLLNTTVLSKPSFENMACEIEPEYWFERNGYAHIILTWVIPNCRPANSLTDVSDVRQLGICFSSFCISPLRSELSVA